MREEAPAGASGRSLFVTGTDTGVGKTWVSAALAAAARGRGLRVGVLKPAETGWPASAEEAGRLTDGALLKRASGDGDSLEEIVPFRYPDPLAPSVAARRVGEEVDPRMLLGKLDAKRASHDLLIVEGAGGLMVPLSERWNMLDFATRARLPVLVVAANRLGVLNHVMLTVDRLRAARRPCCGVLLNETSPGDPDLAMRTNVAELRRLLGETWLGSMPWCDGPPGGPAAVHALEHGIDLDALLNHLL